MHSLRNDTKQTLRILLPALILLVLPTGPSRFKSPFPGEVGPAQAVPEERGREGGFLWKIGPAIPLPAEGVPQQLWASAAPDDPDRLLVCTFEADGTRARFASAAYVSLDAGNTWMRTLLDTDSEWVSETTCAAGTRGRDYFAAGVSDTTVGVMRHEYGSAEMFRSSDGGLSWSLPRRYPFIDWMTMGVFSTGKDDEVYLFGNIQAGGIGDHGDGEWRKPTRPVLVSPNGLDYSAPAYPSEVSSSDRQEGFPLSVVTSGDGSAMVLFAEIPQNKFVLYRYNRKRYERISMIQMPPGVKAYGPLSAHMAADLNGRFPGRLYAAIPAIEDEHPVLVLSSSVDFGATWSSVVLLRRSDETNVNGMEYFSAGVAVNPAGDVGIEWLSSRHCPEFAISADGGQSVAERHVLGRCAGGESKAETACIDLGPFIKVYSDRSPVDHPLKYSAEALPGFTVQVVSSTLASVQITADSAGRFHAFWPENGPRGVTTFTSTIAIAGKSVGPISTDGAEDVTDRSVIHVERQTFDASEGRFDVDISVQDKSSGPIPYPSFLEVAANKSDCGQVRFLNAYATSSRGNAMFRVPERSDKDLLFPAEKSLTVHLEVVAEGCEARSGSVVSRSRLQALKARPFFPLAVRFRVFSQSNEPPA